MKSIGGQQIESEKQSYSYGSNGDILYIVEKFSGQSWLVTTSCRYSDTAAPINAGKIKWIEHMDGTLTRHTYANAPDPSNPSLSALKIVSERGVADAAQFAPSATGPVPELTQGTRTETLTNTFDRLVFEKNTDIESGLPLSEWQAVAVDEVGRPTHRPSAKSVCVYFGSKALTERMVSGSLRSALTSW